MNRRSTIVAGILAASAVSFGIAYAQGPGCDHDGGPGMKHGWMQHGRMGDPSVRVEQRLTRLKGELKLTPQQEPLWQAFAEKSKAEAGKGFEAMRERMKDDKPLSAPERMAQMQGLMKQRVTAMESVTESFNRLYEGLTPEQKATADKHFSLAGRRQAATGHRGPHGERPAAPAAAEARKP